MKHQWTRLEQRPDLLMLACKNCIRAFYFYTREDCDAFVASQGTYNTTVHGQALVNDHFNSECFENRRPK